LSDETVKMHNRNILYKFSDRTQATLVALRSGLVDEYIAITSQFLIFLESKNECFGGGNYNHQNNTTH
jgi:hypothetical protein